MTEPGGRRADSPPLLLPRQALIGKSGLRERLAVLPWCTLISTELHKGFSPWLWPMETAGFTRQAVKPRRPTRLAQLGAMWLRCDFVAGAHRTGYAYGFTIVHRANLRGIPLTAWPHLQAWTAAWRAWG
ncbi:hypothetical protein [Acidovorax sp. 69]|uniref:hypothetical protein n=1 Tax=Acidovorax sp. 69 TaxID=2035202 RepID=UPI0012FDE1EB|nr:hypothetical protein [Acidovorax sp. 69]